MSAVVDCPTCARPLRIPDDLRGDTVRCPTCGNMLAAPPETTHVAHPEADVPVTTEVVAPLEIGEHQIIPRVPELRPTLVGEERGKPSRPSAPRAQATLTAVDARTCPACGERASGRARHCVRCGEMLGPPEDAPWPYNDCEPHRAGLLLALGIASLVLAATCLLSLVGLPLGIAAVVLGRRDLQKMRAGTMDPDGKNTVQAGLICGVTGIAVNTLLVLYLGAAVLSRGYFVGF
jgi:hypothetical protein